MQFRLYDDLVGGNQISYTFAAPAQVSNGLFTVTLNFGPGVFDGDPRWLEIYVRTNGGSAYTVLLPRQHITAAPHAIFANTAGSVSIGAISSSQIAPGQVVKSLNGLRDNVSIVAGTNMTLDVQANTVVLSSAPGGAIGFTWETVSGPNQQAQANHGYVVTNSAETTILLPTNVPFGSTIRVVSAGTAGWRITQNDGQTISATNIVTNTMPVGYNWNQRAFVTNWSAVALSTNGNVMYAAVVGGNIYRSTNSGVNWSVLPSIAANWKSLACSADGNFVVGAVNGGQLRISSDSGFTWTPREGNRNWISVDCSSDGTKAVAAASNGQLYTSYDAGVTWTARDFIRNWLSVSCSANGSNMLAAVTNGYLYTSYDSGQTWISRDSIRGWSSVATSDFTSMFASANSGGVGFLSSGNAGTNWSVMSYLPGPPGNYFGRLIACNSEGRVILAGHYSSGGGPASTRIVTAIDYGGTWTQSVLGGDLTSAAVSGDGTTMIAAFSDIGLYTSQQSPELITSTPGPAGYLAGTPGAAVELIYTGNNRFVALSFMPSINSH